MVLQQGSGPNKGLGSAFQKSVEAKPLTESVEDQFKDVNLAAASNAVAKVHDNKVYFMVPTGSSTTNNKIFVYSILNNALESIDTSQAVFRSTIWVELFSGRILRDENFSLQIRQDGINIQGQV